MALHLNLEEHDADPPSGWTVKKEHDKLWNLLNKNGYVLSGFSTKTKAEQAKTEGFLFELYEKEGRWFRGEQVDNWKPYAQVVADRERNRKWQEERKAAGITGITDMGSFKQD